MKHPQYFLHQSLKKQKQVVYLFFTLQQKFLTQIICSSDSIDVLNTGFLLYNNFF